MANTPTVVIGSLNDEELKKSIDKLVNHVDQQLNYMVSSTKVAVMSMNKSLKSLGDTKIDFGSSADGGASKRTKAQNAETVAVKESAQAYKEKTMTLDQQASAINAAIQSEKKYTDEIRNQAAAIRATKEWQEKGRYWLDGIQLIDPSVYKGTRAERQAQGTLEDQLLRIQKAQTEEIEKQVKEEKKLAETVAQTAKTVSYKRDLQMSLAGFGVKNVKDVTDEQVKQYEKLDTQLAKLKDSYAAMSEEKKKSEQGIGLSKSITDLQKQRTDLLLSIKSQLSEGKKATVPDQFASLRQSIANVLGVQKENISLLDIEKTSSERLAKELKMLQLAYSKLSASRIAKGDGTDIANEIQRVQRALQKLQATQTRPTSLKSVMGLDEKTLDDIAYKMRQLASYRSGLNVATQTKEITQVNDEYNRLKKRMDEVMQKNQQMIASNTALGRSWNYMKNRLAFYFTVGASTQFVKNLIEVRSQYEMNERALGILINSAERGTQIFNELSQMALVSPYTLIELSSAAKQLTAYDIAAKDVVNTTRRLADMAAAVGIPIERLTYALGQVKAYGYLNARDARMFANAGIPLVKNLSEYYTELEGRLVSTADIYDRIKNKQIGYEEVMSTISKMTDEGGKFFDFQAKMAETLKVQLANLTLAWNNMLNDMGEESQGVLVGGIGALKQMFLHWKDIEHILTEVVVTLGAYKAYQLVTTRLMGATSASLDAQILAMKRNNAAMLEKQSLTRKLTYDEAKLIATQNQLTAADYKNALSGKSLTKQKALLLVALNKNNVQLKAAIVNMGLLTAQEAANVTTGRALAIVFKSIGISIRNAAMAMKAFMVSNWWMLALGGIYELYHAWDSYNEHVAEINRSAAEHAKEAYENIKQYLEGDVISALQDNLAKGGKVSSDAEGQKAWDEMREKIELSSSASNVFIARLMQIDDINERLSAGFGYLEDIQRVAGVMQTLEKDAVDVSSTTLGGLFGEGLKDDLQDFLESKDAVISAYGDMGKAAEELKKQQESANVGIGSILYDMQEFAKEVKKTTDSIYDIASREGFNINQQREFFEREISEIAQAEQMGAKETRIFRIKAEEEYFKRSMEYLNLRLKVQKDAGEAAMAAETEARIKEFKEQFGANKAMQESFFTWLTEKQDHAVKNMLRGKTQEEIKQGEWLKGSNAKWVEEMARKFSKEYGVSFDGLRKLVMDANTWHINIPVFFQTIGQPLSDVQRDYEARTGKKFSSNPLIKDAKTQVEILDILKKKQKEVANEKATAEKAGGKYWEDNKQRYEEENNALIADIHAYNALTDAEEKANKKSGKGGSKKDPLLDALKQEISLVEKLQSDYDKLSKSGASQADALDTIRGAYGKTIRLLNAQLGKYGLPQLDISQLVTGKDPHKALEHFKQTLDTLVSKGLLTLERSKEIEAVIDKFTLSAKTYDLDMITKGLNNELGKLKDEYELAVELDADPELGSIFADMFDLKVDQLPHSINEYAERVTVELNKALKERGDNIQLPTIYLTKDDIDAFRKMSEGGKLNTKSFEEIQKAYQDFVSLRKKAATDVSKIASDYIREYGDLSAQIQQIEIEKNDALMKLNEIYNTDALRQTQRYLDAKFAIEDGAKRKQAKATFDALKKEADYESFFTAIDTLTKKDALSIKNKIKKGIIDAFKDGGLTISQFRKEIKALEEQFDKLSQPTSNWISYLNGGFDKLIQKARETGQEIETIGEKISITGKVDEKDKNYLQSLGNIFSNGKGGNTDFSSLMSHFGKDMKGLGSNISKAGQGMQAGASGFAGAVTIVDAIIRNVHQTVQAIGSVIDELDSVRNEDNKISNAYWEGFKKFDNYAMSGWENLKSGNVAGAIADTTNSIISIFNTFSNAKNERINKEIKESERAVKRLELAYIDLEHAVNEAYGMATIGANMAAKANKELQLAELKRQLALERSRDSKRRDEDRILDLQKQIKELEYDIADTADSIVNDLLGISSVGDAMENMMDAFIEALRSGEDAMATFDENVDEMIANMVKKMYVTKILQPWFEEQWNKIQERINQRAGDIPDKIAKMQSKTSIAKSADTTDNNSLVEALRALGMSDEQIHLLNWYNEFGQYDRGEGRNARLKAAYEKMLKEAEQKEAELQKELTNATMPTMDDIRQYAELVRSGRPIMEENMQEVANFLRELGLMKDDANKNLSALQQGIAGVSEETASAVEAYLNGMSQQAYLRNDLLVQIRDTIMSFDMDVQLGVFSQMLLQLQNNYIVMQSMQSMMEGWTTPSGQGIRVELLS